MTTHEEQVDQRVRNVPVGRCSGCGCKVTALKGLDGTVYKLPGEVPYTVRYHLGGCPRATCEGHATFK